MKSIVKSAYLAPEGFSDQLAREIDGVIETHGRLFMSDQPAKCSLWAQNVWMNPVLIPIQSISDGAGKLKDIQRNWWLYSFKLHRRASLIRDKLPHVSAKPLQFPSPLPKSPLGSWTLLDSDTLLASSRCSSLFPNGEVEFEEDRKGPPSRAYLKLWEALTLLQEFPRPGQFCIDTGGSPGGWAWAIQKLGARVLSVDRSELDLNIMKLPNLEFQKRDAFSLNPKEFEENGRKVDWLFSDVICYPEKLYDWVLEWVESGVCRNFVCTIKFQGHPDYDIARKFLEIPQSRVVHLHHNRHELTWSLIREEERVDSEII